MRDKNGQMSLFRTALAYRRNRKFLTSVALALTRLLRTRYSLLDDQRWYTYSRCIRKFGPLGEGIELTWTLAGFPIIVLTKDWQVLGHTIYAGSVCL